MRLVHAFAVGWFILSAVIVFGSINIILILLQSGLVTSALGLTPEYSINGQTYSTNSALEQEILFVYSTDRFIFEEGTKREVWRPKMRDHAKNGNW
jgi:hypothetical protein